MFRVIPTHRNLSRCIMYIYSWRYSFKEAVFTSIWWSSMFFKGSHCSEYSGHEVLDNCGKRFSVVKPMKLLKSSIKKTRLLFHKFCTILSVCIFPFENLLTCQQTFSLLWRQQTPCSTSRYRFILRLYGSSPEVGFAPSLAWKYVRCSSITCAVDEDEPLHKWPSHPLTLTDRWKMSY